MRQLSSSLVRVPRFQQDFRVGACRKPSPLESGLVVRAAELIPPTTSSSPDDRLDLETLLIIAGVLAALPRQVVHEGLGGEQPFERHRAVLGYVVQRMLPHFAGGGLLFSSFLHKGVDRLLALDQRTGGKFLDGPPPAIE